MEFKIISTIISNYLIWWLLFTPLALYVFIKVYQKLMIFMQVNWKNVDSKNNGGIPIPGDRPSLLPFYWPLDYVNYFGDKYIKKYGHIYYIWHWYKPVLMVSDPVALKEFYSDHLDHKRETNYTCCGKIFQGLMGEAMTTIWGKERFGNIRTLYQNYFSESNVYLHADLIYEEILKWLKKFEPKNNDFNSNSNSNSKTNDVIPTDLHTYDRVHHVPLHILGKAMYGLDLSEKRIARLNYFVALHNEVFGYTHLALSKLPLYEYFPTDANKKLHQFTSEWKDFHLDLYEDYKSQGLENREDFFSKLSPLVYNQQVDHTIRSFHETLGEILLANTDLLYAALVWVLVHLAQYPSCQVKLQSYIDEVFNNNDQQEMEKSQFIKSLSKIEYLNWVVNESARLRPSLHLAMPEKTVRDVTVMGGYQIPKDTTIIVDCYSLNRNPAFWEDSDNFIPERWKNNAYPYSFHRFGLGPRKCMGFRWGHFINNVMLGFILHKYTIELADKDEPEKLKTEGLPFFTPYLPGKIVLKRR